MNNVFSIRYGIIDARSFLIKLPATENALSDLADDMGIPSNVFATLLNLKKSFSFVLQKSRMDSSLQVTFANRCNSSSRVEPVLNDFTCLARRHDTVDVVGLVETTGSCVSPALSMLIWRLRTVFSMTSSFVVSEKYKIFRIEFGNKHYCKNNSLP